MRRVDKSPGNCFQRMIKVVIQNPGTNLYLTAVKGNYQQIVKAAPLASNHDDLKFQCWGKLAVLKHEDKQNPDDKPFYLFNFGSGKVLTKVKAKSAEWKLEVADWHLHNAVSSDNWVTNTQQWTFSNKGNLCNPGNRNQMIISPHHEDLEPLNLGVVIGKAIDNDSSWVTSASKGHAVWKFVPFRDNTFRIVLVSTNGTDQHFIGYLGVKNEGEKRDAHSQRVIVTKNDSKSGIWRLDT